MILKLNLINKRLVTLIIFKLKGKMMKLYRAMTIEEFNKTMEQQKPSFIRRHKFFSQSLEFVENRVMKSTFCNRHLKPSKYIKLVCFEIPDNQIKLLTKLNNKEFMLDARKHHLIHWKITPL